MNILTKKEVANTVGKKPWFPMQIIGECSYAGGITSFDEIIDGNPFLVNNLVNFEKRKTGVVISMMHKLKLYRVAIQFDTINSIELEDKQQVFEHKEKSVVGRAIVGGLILGPIGAIIGGMSGMKDGVQKAEMPDLMIAIDYNDDEGNKVILFSAPYKNKKKISFFFSQVFDTKFKLTS